MKTIHENYSRSLTLLIDRENLFVCRQIPDTLAGLDVREHDVLRDGFDDFDPFGLFGHFGFDSSCGSCGRIFTVNFSDS